MKHSLLIGLTGQKRSGKDTFANAISSIHIPFDRVAFAGKMKEITKIIYNLNDEELEAQKETATLDGITPRKFMQLFGTDFARKLFQDDIWVRLAFDNYNPNRVTIFTDVRFDNEAKVIRSKGGIIIKVIRGEEVPAEHSSEMGVSEDLIDKKILNDSTKEAYEDKAIQLFLDILSKKAQEQRDDFVSERK